MRAEKNKKNQFKFVNNEPALVLSSGRIRILVIADIHLGMTYELEYRGINLPNQKDTILEHIQKLKRKTRCKNLIIVGDAKHALPGTPHEERKEVREFFESLREIFDLVVLVKGNHDTLIEEIVPWLNVVSCVKINRCLFLHGHKRLPKDLSDIDTVIIGHNHPVIKFKDRAGGVYYQRCWLLQDNLQNQKKVKMVVMPGFNVLSGGKAMNEKQTRAFRFLGPVAKKINPLHAHAYLLDGTDLGALKYLEINKMK